MWINQGELIIRTRHFKKRSRGRDVDRGGAKGTGFFRQFRPYQV